MRKALVTIAWKTGLVLALCLAGFFFELHELRKLTLDNPNPKIALAYREHPVNGGKLLRGLGHEVALDTEDALHQWEHSDAPVPWTQSKKLAMRAAMSAQYGSGVAPQVAHAGGSENSALNSEQH